MKACEDFSLVELIGPDAYDFAQRMFSRDIKKLKVGEGALTLFLSAEGKVDSLFWMVLKTEGLMLLVPRKNTADLISKIEHFHFAEKFSVSTPRPLKLESSASAPFESKIRDGHFYGYWRGMQWDFDLTESAITWPDDAQGRIDHLIPRWGVDFDSSAFVFDYALQELCDLDKGCYIGQEVVERIRSRTGHGRFVLSALEFEGTLQPRTEIENSAREKSGLILGTVAPQEGGTVQALALVRYGVSEVQIDGKPCRILRTLA